MRGGLGKTLNVKPKQNSKMVVIHIKNGQADGYLFEASVQDTNDALISGLVRASASFTSTLGVRFSPLPKRYPRSHPHFLPAGVAVLLQLLPGRHQ
jgi:hypothetical protein